MSPKVIISACRTCKSWNGVDADLHFWKNMYKLLSVGGVEYDERTVNWKTKVVDLLFIPDNVKSGRCVVRTLVAKEVTQQRTLRFDNYSLYKDFCLINWEVCESYSTHAKFTRPDSHFINLLNGEATRADLQQTLFINHYLANIHCNFYGPTYKWIKVKKFDPTALDSKIIFDDETMLNKQENDKILVPNDCSDSNFIGILQVQPDPKIIVYDGETGNAIFSWPIQRPFSEYWRRMYDNYLAVCDSNTLELTVIDILTKQEWKRQIKSRDKKFGFMTRYQVVIQLEEQIILWNFIDDTEVVYPTGLVKRNPITMIYNNMWLIYRDTKLYFYDMSDGSLINTLAMTQSRSGNISILSDGRIGVAQSVGCRVISFIDSEVNRKIKVDLMDVDGKVTVHEIAAHQLAQFFFTNVGREEYMTSRVLSSYLETPCQNDEQFVMLFMSSNRDRLSENKTANELFQNVVKPICFNTPYQGWKFDEVAITESSAETKVVYGKVIIVREKKIDGRWQLVSM